MSILMPNLMEFFKSPSTSKILMPTDDLMSVVLPSDDSKDYKEHKAFPRYLLTLIVFSNLNLFFHSNFRQQVYITRVLDPVTIIASLQKPKKFTLFGSDGNEYSWLVKNKVK